MFKVVVILPHPTPYRSPMLQSALDIAGFKLEVWYCEDGNPERPWDPNAFRGNASITLPGWRYKVRGRYLRWNPSVWARLEKTKPDLVLVGGYSDPTMLLAVVWCILKRRHYGFIWESHLLNPRPWWLVALKWVPLRLLIGRTTVNLPTGTAARECLIYYGADPSAMFYFPNTCDVDEMGRRVTVLRQRRPELVKRLGLEDRVTVLFMGRLVRAKNPETLIRAWMLVERRGVNAQLVLVGDGPLRRALEHYVVSNGLRRVIFAGFVEPTRTTEFYAAADVFVLPSTYETWGAVVTEAMAAGLPVITTRWVGSAVDLVRDGENGYVLETVTPDTVAHAILTLIEQPSLRARMGARSRELVTPWGFSEGTRNFLKAVQYAQHRMGKPRPATNWKSDPKQDGDRRA